MSRDRSKKWNTTNVYVDRFVRNTKANYGFDANWFSGFDRVVDVIRIAELVLEYRSYSAKDSNVALENTKRNVDG